MKKGHITIALSALVLVLLGCGKGAYGSKVPEIGFRDEKFDNMFGGREAFAEYLEEMDRDACLELFKEYNALDAQNY